MSQNQEMAFRVKLADFVRAVDDFAEDIEFLRESDPKVKVNVDWYWSMSVHYKAQADSIKRDLNRCVVPIAEQKLKALENQLKKLELGVGDLHRYMRFRNPILGGNNGRRPPDSPMSSGYGSARSRSATPSTPRRNRQLRMGSGTSS